MKSNLNGGKRILGKTNYDYALYSFGHFNVPVYMTPRNPSPKLSTT
jgi:hypothetical protein